MTLPNEVVEFIKHAEHKVLASDGDTGLNVVPLSMVQVSSEEIVICDCFMDKTRRNLSSATPKAVLAFWTGFEGLQLKGSVAYETAGARFDRCVTTLAESHPDRTLCGVIVFTPEAVYDLAPARAGERVV